jgi:hypothetical protein
MAVSVFMLNLQKSFLDSSIVGRERERFSEISDSGLYYITECVSHHARVISRAPSISHVERP